MASVCCPCARGAWGVACGGWERARDRLLLRTLRPPAVAQHCITCVLPALPSPPNKHTHAHTHTHTHPNRVRTPNSGGRIGTNVPPPTAAPAPPTRGGFDAVSHAELAKSVPPRYVPLCRVCVFLCVCVSVTPRPLLRMYLSVDRILIYIHTYAHL